MKKTVNTIKIIVPVVLIGLIVWGFVWGGPMAGGIITAFVLAGTFILVKILSKPTLIEAGTFQEPIPGFQCPECGKQSVVEVSFYEEKIGEEVRAGEIEKTTEDFVISKRVFRCKACGWEDLVSTLNSSV